MSIAAAGAGYMNMVANQGGDDERRQQEEIERRQQADPVWRRQQSDLRKRNEAIRRQQSLDRRNSWNREQARIKEHNDAVMEQWDKEQELKKKAREQQMVADGNRVSPKRQPSLQNGRL